MKVRLGRPDWTLLYANSEAQWCLSRLGVKERLPSIPRSLLACYITRPPLRVLCVPPGQADAHPLDTRYFTASPNVIDEGCQLLSGNE